MARLWERDAVLINVDQLSTGAGDGDAADGSAGDCVEADFLHRELVVRGEHDL